MLTTEQRIRYRATNHLEVGYINKQTYDLLSNNTKTRLRLYYKSINNNKNKIQPTGFTLADILTIKG